MTLLPLQKINEIVLEQLDALKASQYEIGVLRKVPCTNSETAEVYYTNEMVIRNTVRYGQVLKSVKFCYELIEKEPHHIFIRPVSNQYVLIDDIDIETARKMYRDGFEPSCLIETSPDNFQSWIKIEVKGGISNVLRTTLGKYFAKMYNGDTSSIDHKHLGRMAGFPNMKPQYKKPDGTFPIATIHFAQNQSCTNGMSAFKYALTMGKNKETTSLHNEHDVRNIVQTLKVQSKNNHSCDEYACILYRAKHIEYDNPDYHTIDFFVVVKLLKRGFSFDEVYNIIPRYSPHFEERKKNHEHDYLLRTIQKAALSLK